MSAVERIRAALKSVKMERWIDSTPERAAGWHVVETEDGACIDDSGDGGFLAGKAQYIAACNPAAMVEVLAHIDAQQAEIERLLADAARYQWLRNQHWTNNTLCVVARPKDAMRIGHDAPSGDRLDELIDAATKYETSESEGRNDCL